MDSSLLPMHSSRRDMRALSFYLLYAMDAFDYTVDLPTVIKEFNTGFDLAINLEGEEAVMVSQIIDNKDVFEKMLVPLFANWRPERIGRCTYLILLMATWELFFTKNAPTIIINEAIELSKCFSEKDAYKFINGVLDELFKRFQDRVMPTL